MSKRAHDTGSMSLAHHARGVAKAMAACCAAHVLIRRARWRGARVEPSARWFALHSLANTAIAATGLRDVLAVLARPAHAMQGSVRSWTPSHLAFAVHLYHAVAFGKLRAEDVLHHVLFVGVFGAAANFTMRWGPVVNCLLFFITGVPGAIDYAMLAAVKQGLLPPLREKRANALINTYVRNPGLLFVATIIFACTRSGKTQVHPAASGLVALLAYGNGTFYGAQVVADYHRRDALNAKRG
eukprot:g4097.t1